MRKISIVLSSVSLLALVFIIKSYSPEKTVLGERPLLKQESYLEINGNVKKGDTFFKIFKQYGLSMGELFSLREAAAAVHRLRELSPEQPYKIVVDDKNRINSFSYQIDDDSILNVTRNDTGFYAEKKIIQFEKRIEHVGDTIKDNLISSIGEGRENLMLALRLSDIFAWDIDFTTDLRNGDTFKIIVEGFYLDGELKKYGDVLSAELVNNGKTYRAYRFEYNRKIDYFNEKGHSLRKAFLKAPLNFRRISSYFSKGRFHPILKIYRPHHGVDYTAPKGTPVSSVADGSVVFAGRKGQYGNLVMLKHRNSYKTYYGHLSQIGKGIKKGKKVEQGQIIGYVGATGLATGPHLHYEMRIKNKPVNPFSAKIPHQRSISKTLTADFNLFKNEMNARLASITLPVFVFAEKEADNTGYQ
ncbi:MAG: peptidoglycan DD-metalloendopeptidase family protein [Candidatus Roizmanbacteria bacterium]|nr:peptidoglycan DD-metalloendopeptidase family protein [Candidatus Roizmanbacteria bacterium]